MSNRVPPPASADRFGSMAVPPDDAMEEIVVDVFRRQLLMEPDEELDRDISFFDLGLTSLRLTEAKQQLEAELDLCIDATVLFNRPTVTELLAYLSGLAHRTVTAG